MFVSPMQYEVASLIGQELCGFEYDHPGASRTKFKNRHETPKKQHSNLQDCYRKWFQHMENEAFGHCIESTPVVLSDDQIEFIENIDPESDSDDHHHHHDDKALSGDDDDDMIFDTKLENDNDDDDDDEISGVSQISMDAFSEMSETSQENPRLLKKVTPFDISKKRTSESLLNIVRGCSTFLPTHSESDSGNGNYEEHMDLSKKYFVPFQNQHGERSTRKNNNNNNTLPRRKKDTANYKSINHMHANFIDPNYLEVSGKSKMDLAKWVLNSLSKEKTVYYDLVTILNVFKTLSSLDISFEPYDIVVDNAWLIKKCKKTKTSPETILKSLPDPSKDHYKDAYRRSRDPNGGKVPIIIKGKITRKVLIFPEDEGTSGGYHNSSFAKRSKHENSRDSRIFICTHFLTSGDMGNIVSKWLDSISTKHTRSRDIPLGCNFNVDGMPSLHKLYPMRPKTTTQSFSFDDFHSKTNFSDAIPPWGDDVDEDLELKYAKKHHKESFIDSHKQCCEQIYKNICGKSESFTKSQQHHTTTSKHLPVYPHLYILDNMVSHAKTTKRTKSLNSTQQSDENRMLCGNYTLKNAKTNFSVSTFATLDERFFSK